MLSNKINPAHVAQRCLCVLSLLFFLVLPARAQQVHEYHGKINYITSQNIYVRFDEKNDLQVGDTIFVSTPSGMKPLLLIESKSTYSAIGKPFPDINPQLGQEVIGRSKEIQMVSELPVKLEPSPVENKVKKAEEEEGESSGASEFREKIRGRLSASSYSAFSGATNNESQRFRYSLSLQANNIADSRFSFETYTNFSYYTSDWTAVRDNLFNALKIYSLAMQYQAGKNTSIWLGRKINPNLSNVGAIDGLQVETKTGQFSWGAVAGFRPDYSNYGFNSDLLEYGIYAVHQAANQYGAARTSLAFFEQTNNSKTDRRFVYFQHSNTLLKDLFLFLSSEVDLYKLQDGQSRNTFRLTGFYLSLRYRMSQSLWASASYDNRKNVIYYETYKSMVDQLLAEATRQGVQLRLNYRPTGMLSVGGSANYRKRDNDPRASTSFNGFLTLNQLPSINSTVTFTGNLLKTTYLDGGVYGVQLFKDFANNKLSSVLGYRYVDYRYLSSQESVAQHVADVEMNWRIAKKLSLSADYELSFEKGDRYNRIYINLTKRF